MAFGSPIATTSFTFPSFDLGLGRTKKGVDFARETITLGALGVETLFTVASIGAGVANTTIQGYFAIPGRCKIPKIVVYCTALNALTGHSFNIVFGATAAYTPSATTIPGNDNSSVPPVAYNSNGQATGGSSPTYAAGGGGFCTNPAVPGNTMFSADVVLSAANFPANSNGSVTIPAIATATGLGDWARYLIPPNPDAVWPQGAVLTLRVTTPASTGSISNFVIGAYIEPQPMSATYPSSQQAPAYIPVGGVDF